MMKKYILIGLFSFLCLTAWGQQEIYNWTFGHHAGLTWKNTRSFPAIPISGLTEYPAVTLSGFPTHLTVNSSIPAISTNEGCFSLSDAAGNLLLFSDGSTIWGANNAAIPGGTGLAGHSSSAQSGIIMPLPGDKTGTKYVVLSLDQYAISNTRVKYTIVDLSKGAYGAVATDASSNYIKNVSLENHTGTLGESMNVIVHDNKSDFWIVAPGRGDNTYLNAWLMTNDGKIANNGNPISSPTGVAATVSTGATTGYLKFSPDGKYFVWAGGGSGKFIVYGKFNSKTGAFTNIQKYDFSSSPYGVEFSQSGKYLYVSTLSSITAFDFNDLLTAGSSYSPTVYGGMNRSNSAGYSLEDRRFIGALQLAPDGRIYATYAKLDQLNQDDPSQASARDLLVLENIEKPSQLKIYRLANFLAASGTTGAVYGLPSFSPSWFSSDINGPKEVCIGQSEEYSITVLGSRFEQAPTNIKWYFNNSATPIEDNLVLGQATKRTFLFSATGQIPIRADICAGATVLNTETYEVTVNPAPVVSSALATPGSGTVTLKATVSSGATAEWYASDGTTYLGSSASGANFVIASGGSSFKVKAKNLMCESAFTSVSLAGQNRFIRVNPHIKSGF